MRIESGVPGVLGIHIEGPFLNAARKGVHDPAKLRELDRARLGLLTSLGRGRTLVTLAPEMTTPEIIAQLVARGVVVSAGHTNATLRGDRRRRSTHGLRGFTHLFNAMSPLTSREPGVVGAALDDPDSWCGIIVDGDHVDPVALRIALRCKPHDRFMLVTDAMPSRRHRTRPRSCCRATHHGARHALRATRTARSPAPTSTWRAACAMRYASSACRWSRPCAWRARYPADFLGLAHELGRIAPGYRANLVLADEDLKVLATWIDGEVAPSASL